MIIEEGRVLVLRSVDANRQSYGGFQWPELGPVECPDWDPSAVCGYGLHGWLRGEGDGACAQWGPDRVFQVVLVEEAACVHLGGKVKFPRGVVLYTGDIRTAADMIKREYATAAVIGGTAAAGDYGTATAGHGGTATAGDRGTATAGDYGTATAGDYGTATAGYRGTATAGHGGTATAGDRGTATAGDYGTATAGDCGILQIAYFEARRRIAIAYVGAGGIEPNVPYRLNASHKFERVDP